MIQIDIEMPETCSECPFYSDTGDRTYNFHCVFFEYDFVFNSYNTERLEECPLRESVSK